MSGALILAQGLVNEVTSFPGWIRPALCSLRFTTASTGVPSVVATETSPGVSVTEDGSTDGLYHMTFPKCRKFKWVSGTVSPATPGTASNHRHIRPDQAVPLSGTLDFRSIAANGGALSSPENGSTVDVLFWIDLG